MVLLCYNISKGGVYMILVYTSFGCASCRKVKQWLKDRNIPFVEKNIFTMMLNEKELRMLLRRSENGTDDIISKRSKIIKENNIDNMVSMNLSLLELVQSKLISEKEALENSSEPNELEKMFRGIYQGTKAYYE